MSRAKCAVYGCSNNKSNKQLSFFQLPGDEERRNQWLELIGRTDLLEKKTLKHRSHHVCSVHFQSDMITHMPQLKLDALPSKHLPNDSSESEIGPSSPSVSTQDIENGSSETVAVQTEEDSKAETSSTLNKRTLEYRLKESEKKRKKLEDDLKKIKKELKDKNALCQSLIGWEK